MTNEELEETDDPTERSHAAQVHRWLSKYAKLVGYERRLREIVDEQLEQADALKGIDYSRDVVSTSPYPDAIPDAVARHVELSEVYGALASEAASDASAIVDAIAALADVDGRAALAGHYVQGVTWERLCVDMSVSYRTMMRIRHRALVEIYDRDLMPASERFPRQPAI